MTATQLLRSPPSYEATEAEREMLLEVLRETTAAETATGSHADEKVARLRNFLLYILSCDYQRLNFAPSASDRDHFTLLHRTLRQLRDTHGRPWLPNGYRETMASYFWKYLHEPCKALAIPIEAANETIVRFFKFQNFCGQYKGSIYGLLHSRGIEYLARKLQVDRTILIPRLLECQLDMQRDMLQGLDGVSEIYFISIAGWEGSNFRFGKRPWSHWESLSYVLTERGRWYEKSRNTALGVAAAPLSPQYWATKIKWCLEDLRRKSREVLFDHKPGESKGTFKGPGTLSNGVNLHDQYPFFPRGWDMPLTSHIPDLFEHRPTLDKCDM